MGLLHGLLTRDSAYGRNNLHACPRVCVIERGVNNQHADGPLLDEWFLQARSSPSQHAANLQGRYNYTLPTGQGRGGTTNIHAGLALWPPSEDFQNTTTNQWPNGFHSSVQKIQEQLRVSTQSSSGGLVEDPTIDATIRFPSVVNDIPCTSDAQGKRINYYEALVKPFLSKPTNPAISITWIDEAEVQRILVQPKSRNDDGDETSSIASGVQYQKDGRSYQVQGSTTVLAAGVLESPRILVKSGLVPQKTTFDLWDHTVVPFAMLHWPPQSQSENHRSFNGVASMHHFQMGRHSYQLSRFDATLLPSILPALAVDFLLRRHIQKPSRLLDRLARILERVLRIITTAFFSIPFFGRTIIVWGVNMMSPSQPIGTLKVGTYSQLTINLDYLKDNEELHSLQHQAWPVLHRIASSKAWEFFPGAWVRQKFFGSWARFFCLPYFHWCGALSEWVDPHTLKCRNTSNVLVCDASAFPSLPRAPTAPTCAALGYHVAHLLMLQRK